MEVKSTRTITLVPLLAKIYPLFIFVKFFPRNNTLVTIDYIRFELGGQIHIDC